MCMTNDGNIERKLILLIMRKMTRNCIRKFKGSLTCLLLSSPPQLKKPKSLLNTVLQLRSSQSMLLCFNA